MQAFRTVDRKVYGRGFRVFYAGGSRWKDFPKAQDHGQAALEFLYWIKWQENGKPQFVSGDWGPGVKYWCSVPVDMTLEFIGGCP